MSPETLLYLVAVGVALLVGWLLYLYLGSEEFQQMAECEAALNRLVERELRTRRILTEAEASILLSVQPEVDPESGLLRCPKNP